VRDDRERIDEHEKWSEWREYLVKGSETCFSLAPISSPERERAQADLIYHHKPQCNDQHKGEFPFENTSVKSSGRCAVVSGDTTVHKASQRM
jgi:hypothetical protein